MSGIPPLLLIQADVQLTTQQICFVMMAAQDTRSSPQTCTLLVSGPGKAHRQE